MLDKNKETALIYAEKRKSWVEKKANKNRRNSNFLIGIVIVSAAISPILILFQSDKYLAGFWIDFVSKILPACFTSLAAIASSWIQLRKPQERWVMQRTIEKEIESEIIQFKYEIGKYENQKKKEAILVKEVNDLLLKLHYKWSKIIPTAKDLKS